MTQSTTYRISAGDEIIATLKSSGRQLAAVAKRDFGCIADVMSAMLSVAAPFSGFAVASVRNKSQGWSTNLIIASPHARRNSIKQHTPVATPTAPRQGAQYLIPW